MFSNIDAQEFRTVSHLGKMSSLFRANVYKLSNVENCNIELDAVELNFTLRTMPYTATNPMTSRKIKHSMMYNVNNEHRSN